MAESFDSKAWKRREVLKLGAASALAATGARAQGKHQFFTDSEWTITDEITEILVPADAVSAGARAAKVADYIDARLAEAFDDEPRTTWREGLAAVDKLARKINNVGFLQGTEKQREAVVLAMSENEKEPKTPTDRFFREMKGFAIRGYYTTSIGIHKDMDYKGNVYQQGDYAGTLPPGPALAKPGSTE